jgi:TonB family protein
VKLVALVVVVLGALAASSTQADSRAKAIAIHTVKPKYSRELPEGKGVYLLHLVSHTGNVLSVTILKSTGSPVLDRNAIEALKQWRFRPGTSETVRMPMEFTHRPQSAFLRH